MAISNFVWDELSDNLLLEIDDADGITEYSNEPDHFGELISQRRNSTTSFYHFDAHRSTRQLTSDNEAETDVYLYSAFGETIGQLGTTKNSFRFQGAVGCYTNQVPSDIYVRRRTYVPILGRWLSPDPLGFVNGPNVYRPYFLPNEVDPSGTLVITTVDVETGNCGNHEVYFKFCLSRPAPCDGYFVQEIKVAQKIDRCTSPVWENCPTSVDDLPMPPKWHFWEAWYLDRKVNRLCSWDTIKLGYTDASTEPSHGGTCGIVGVVGVVQFFCKEPQKPGGPATGDIGDRGRNPPKDTGGWEIDNLKTLAHDIPSTTDRPKWWGETPVDGPEIRIVYAQWNCCPGKVCRDTDLRVWPPYYGTPQKTDVS